MPPPSLLSSTIASGRSSRRAASRPPMSWARATSPMSRTVGRPAAATPKAVETVPSMPLAPRLESTRGGRSRAGKNVSTSRTGIEEATTRVASAGRRTPSSAATRGSERLGKRGRDRGGRRAVGAASTSPASRGPCAAARAPARAGRRPTIVATAPAGSCHASSASNAICSALVEPVQPLAQRLGGRQVADAQHEVGRVAGGPLGVAQQRVVVRDRCRAAARAGQRVGEQRQRERVGERGERLAEAGVALAAARDDHAARVRVDRRAQAVEQRLRGARLRARPRDPRAAAGAPAAAGLLLGQRLVEHERLAQREVEVDRAGAAVERGPERAAGELAQPAHALGRGRLVVDLEVPLGRAAVELDLVDRLPGAELAQLGRAVGGEDEQRHARLVGLDHRGRVVGRRGARGAGERHRHAGRLGQPEREEAAAALVDVRGRADARLAREREHERRRARARRGAGLAQAAARQLVDEGAQAEVRVGGWHRLRSRARRPRPPPRLHADRRELGRGGARARGTLPRARARPGRGAVGGRARPARGARPARVHAVPATRWAGGSRWRSRCGIPSGCGGSCWSRRARAGRRGRARGAARRPTRRWRTGSRRSASRRSRASGRRSRCSPASRRRSPPPRTRTGCGARAAEHAAQLRGLGTGVMPPLWERLGELAMPVTLVVGERDAKFRAIAERMGVPDRGGPGRRPRRAPRGARRGVAAHLRCPERLAARAAAELASPRCSAPRAPRGVDAPRSRGSGSGGCRRPSAGRHAPSGRRCGGCRCERDNPEHTPWARAAALEAERRRDGGVLLWDP